MTDILAVKHLSVAFDTAAGRVQAVRDVSFSLHRRVSRAAANRRALELLTQVGIEDASHRFHQYPHEFLRRPAHTVPDRRAPRSMAAK